ncbi:TPA: hypothetical protein ACH3X1_009165 [Trebouxia sp. C0004]
MLTASNSMMTMNSCHVRRSTICSGFNAPLIRPRPALKLFTVLNQREGRVPSHSQRPLVSCQHSPLSQTRKALHTPEVCLEAGVQKPVPAWQRLASFLLKSTAMVALALALTFVGVSSAEAARSGGRMGGSSFSAARSGGGSYSSGSSSRSYGGSIGGGSSSRSYGGSTGYGSFLGPGLAGGYGYGYGYGGGFGGPVVQRSDGGSGFITILVVVAALFIASQVASNVFGNSDDGDSGSGRSTVCKLQVGLLGSARSLQRDLERIAGRADTNTPDGLHYVLQETVLSLLRNPDYCVYGDGGTKNPRGLDGAEDAFNEVVLQERGKFKEETLVNVGGRSKRSSLKSRSDGMSELIVVTLIVAAEGGVKVPKVTSREDLTKALNKLGALRSEQILAVEVMWTPQAEDDYYTRDELFLDYPTLNTL